MNLEVMLSPKWIDLLLPLGSELMEAASVDRVDTYLSSHCHTPLRWRDGQRFQTFGNGYPERLHAATRTMSNKTTDRAGFFILMISPDISQMDSSDFTNTPS